MLSYMVPSPIEDKPPLAPNGSSKNGLQLVLDNHINNNGGIPLVHQTSNNKKNISNGGSNNSYNTTNNKKAIKTTTTTTASANSSNSSLNSTTGDIPGVHGCVNTSVAEKPKSKVANGTGKQTTLKRVSFGSSKGSMVETLIYETPVQEEPEPVPSQLVKITSADKIDEIDFNSGVERIKIPSSRVRVSFFESSDKKYIVSAPDNYTNYDFPDDLVIYEQFTMSSPSQPNRTTLHCSYMRQESTDSGWENPFRPDGDLSKEADEIVELIKEGKPITPTQGNNPSKLIEGNGTTKKSVNQSFSGNKVNGSVNPDNKVVTGVEVQHGTIATPTDGSQIEHVVIKKKPKCKCCVIQ